ncbi:hypothetical protein AGDE_10464, partial [Angomonas deanei]
MHQEVEPVLLDAVVEEYDMLTEKLHIPRIDRELYEHLFVKSLRDYLVQAQSKSKTPLTVRVGDLLADNVLGTSIEALQLVIQKLQQHQALTVNVLKCITHREAVLSNLIACNAFYERNACTLDDAQQTFLHGLQELQLITLLVTEAIFHWRENISRPYPFLLKKGENYLLRINEDAVALSNCAVGASLNLKMSQFPCNSNIDIGKMRKRQSIMRRTRLVNTGAALQRGLKPVTPTPKRTFAYGSPSLWRRDNDSTATGGRRSANHSGATSRAGSARRSSDAFTPTTVDGNEEVALALEELAVLIQSGTNAPSTQFGGYAMNQHGNLRAAQRRKNSRLKAAEKLILNEYELQKKLNEELFHEADSRDRFVLVLPTPQLFNLKFGEEDDNHNGDDREWPVLKDSLPLNKSEWDGLFDKQYFMLNAKRKSRM